MFIDPSTKLMAIYIYSIEKVTYLETDKNESMQTMFVTVIEPFNHGL